MLHTRTKRRNTQETDHIGVITKINEADRIVIGAGAGLSASAGLDYNSEAVFADMYLPFHRKGYKTISETMAKYWELSEDNQLAYWGFWANHINNIYYQQEQLALYKQLFHLIKDKNYFIITSNGDGQFFKGGFDHQRIFAMQGSYGKFQCQLACNNDVYDNEAYIQQMLKGFNEISLEVKEEDVPRCPTCGGLLCPNLRVNQYFVNGTNMNNRQAYGDFVTVTDEVIFYLELGVGFNTPGIIRYPFEDMVNDYPYSTLIRVNLHDPEIPEEIKDKSIGKAMDIGQFISELKPKTMTKGQS